MQRLTEHTKETEQGTCVHGIYLLLSREPSTIRLSSIKATVSDVVSPVSKQSNTCSLFNANGQANHGLNLSATQGLGWWAVQLHHCQKWRTSYHYKMKWLHFPFVDSNAQWHLLKTNFWSESVDNVAFSPCTFVPFILFPCQENLHWWWHFLLRISHRLAKLTRNVHFPGHCSTWNAQ